LDAYRIDDEYYIDIELPGVDPADIDVTADKDVLTVRAERKPTEGNEQRNPEQKAEPFTREVSLAERLDTDRLEARYDNGVLTLRIPRKDKAVAA
jgi:HSP20 family protein